MLGVQYHANGDTKKVREMVRRADPADLERNCFAPFIAWVLKKRIPLMYWASGRVSGSDGQPAWPALSKWTLASKGVGQFISGAGARGKLTSPMTTAQMRMEQSYQITHSRSSGSVFRFELTNKARSTSRWSPGFDYPSALHTGWGPYVVKPRSDGPGFLAWPMRAGTQISASMGRMTGSGHEGLGWYKTTRIKQKNGKWKKVRMTRSGIYSAVELVSAKKHREHVSIDQSGWFSAMETHPSGAPKREHIKFFNIDVIKLGDVVLRYVFRNQREAAA